MQRSFCQRFAPDLIYSVILFTTFFLTPLSSHSSLLAAGCPVELVRRKRQTILAGTIPITEEECKEWLG
jgi:hypothetical protein